MLPNKTINTLQGKSWDNLMRPAELFGPSRFDQKSDDCLQALYNIRL